MSIGLASHGQISRVSAVGPVAVCPTPRRAQLLLGDFLPDFKFTQRETRTSSRAGARRSQLRGRGIARRGAVKVHEHIDATGAHERARRVKSHAVCHDDNHVRHAGEYYRRRAAWLVYVAVRTRQRERAGGPPEGRGEWWQRREFRRVPRRRGPREGDDGISSRQKNDRSCHVRFPPRECCRRWAREGSPSVLTRAKVWGIRDIRRSGQSVLTSRELHAWQTVA